MKDKYSGVLEIDKSRGVLWFNDATGVCRLRVCQVDKKMLTAPEVGMVDVVARRLPMGSGFVNLSERKEKVSHILLEEYGLLQEAIDQLMLKHYDEVAGAVPGGDADQLAEVLVAKLVKDKGGE